ncbi:MAG: hypothetical protein AAFN77_04855 [Planctomycetota bacterium]
MRSYSLILTTSFTLMLLFSSQMLADEVTLIPADGFVTGANINALAGPLFSSDLGSTDVPGPGSFGAAASKDGNSATHSLGIELDYSTGPAFFDSTYSAPFFRTPTLDHRASAESIFYFTVDTPAFYLAEGFFAVDDEAATMVPGNVELELELLEFESLDMGAPPPTALLYSYQVSKSTIDEMFMVGGMEGDSTSVMVGDVVGLLDPSKFYRYRTLVTTNAIDIDGAGILPPTDGMATATGAHILLITPVPEPTGTWLLFAMAMPYLCVRRRKQSD